MNMGKKQAKALKVFALAAGFLAGFVLSALGAGVEQLEDSRIQSAVTVELRNSPDVRAHLVEVNTEKGIVTLSGTVENVLARDRAGTIAGSIKGVRAVVNNVEVEPENVSDEEIERTVKTALLHDPAADSYELDVTVKGGEVTLSGEVQSWAEKGIAEKVVKGVRGVKKVENDVHVTYAEERPDEEIAKEVRRRLAISTRIDDGLIDVKVVDGEIDLSGSVGSVFEKSLAETRAWVGGVDAVDTSDLEVRWWLRNDMKRDKMLFDLDDPEIKKAVKDAFLYNPRIVSMKVNVQVDQGVVTLTGRVNSPAAKKEAEETALATIGVRRVKNLITVWPMIPPDKTLAERVDKAIKRNPFLSKREITVLARNGRVELHGSVFSGFEKQEAEEVVNRVRGVAKVDNNLFVSYEWEKKDDDAVEYDTVSQLFWDAYVDSGNVTVTVDNGVVTLTGNVDSWYERRRAAENAYQAGAKDVNNQLKIINGDSPTP